MRGDKLMETTAAVQTLTDELLGDIAREYSQFDALDPIRPVLDGAARLISDQFDELRTLRAENAELRKDAGRYRWLRDSAWYVGPDEFYCGEGGDMNEYENHNCQAETLDIAIDTAMEQAK